MKRSPGQRIELQGDAMETATRTDSHDQRPLRKKEKKSLKRPKQDSQFQPELRIKMCSK